MKVQFEVYNLGTEDVHPLSEMISLVEEGLGMKAKKASGSVQMKKIVMGIITFLIAVQTYMLLAGGDVIKTYANVTKARADLGYAPTVGLRVGLSRFFEWYKEYYNLHIPGIVTEAPATTAPTMVAGANP